MQKKKNAAGKKQAVKPVKAPVPKLPDGWFLISRTPLTVRDIKAVFPADADIEIWPEAGVLEIILGDKMSMDIEEMDASGEPDITSLFYISFKKEAWYSAEPVLKKIKEALPVTLEADE